MSVFTKVSVKKPRFNTFDLSHDRKFSTSFGDVVPCFVAETVPNDTFHVNTSQLIRLAPLVSPVMHRMSAYVHFFFVPNRICWKGWPEFINGGVDGNQTPAFPFVDLNGLNEGTLGDFLGLPTWSAGHIKQVSAIPFFAYQKIWYDYFRDQNLSATIPYLEPDGDQLDDGDNTIKLSVIGALKKRAWQHDYFTSALPWTQRGAEATIPLGASADIDFTPNQRDDVHNLSQNFPIGFLDVEVSSAAISNVQPLAADRGGGVRDAISIDNSANLSADLSTATAASINELRRAFRLQEWLELNARAGSRYNEMIMAHFGISVGDARIQRPEYLGGSSTPIVISEVLQTSETATSPQGNMAGHGISVGGKNLFSYTCKEHGYIIGVMSIMPKSAYQQGIPKHFLKFDKFDYFWKSFANIGEQAIENQELYVANDGLDEDTFGYTPRYAEYKYLNDTVHGVFRTSLDFWHAGRIFGSRPTLSEDFVLMQSAEVTRIFAVANEQFYVQMHHQVKAKRPMPYFGTPTM